VVDQALIIGLNMRVLLPHIDILHAIIIHWIFTNLERNTYAFTPTFRYLLVTIRDFLFSIYDLM